MLLTQLINN